MFLSKCHGREPKRNTRGKISLWLAIIGLSLLTGISAGETSKRFGDYELHYNAFHSVDVSPKAIRAHQLKRGPNTGMLNISLLKYGADDQPTAERAKVVVKSKNLVGQIKNLEVKPIIEPGALYYIAHFRFANEETYQFNIFVTPENAPDKTFEVSFNQKFYR